MLEPVVLRGIVVREDALAVELRLGTSKANAQAPGNRNSTRHPSLAGQGVFGPDVDYPASGDRPGAGRPRPTWWAKGC
jgi:hypothetical protein